MLHAMTDSFQDLDARLDRLERALDARGGIMVSALDGFIAALWLLPEAPPHEAWLASVLEFKEGEDSRTTADIVRVVLDHYNAVGYALRSEVYTPVFAIGDEDPETTIWQIWAEGFGHAVGLFSDAFEAWLSDDSATGDAFRLMVLMTGLAMDDGEVEQDMEAQEVAEMKANAPDIIVAALCELYDARLAASGA